MTTSPRIVGVAALFVALLSTSCGLTEMPVTSEPRGQLGQALDAAALESGVPVELLTAWGYQQSRFVRPEEATDFGAWGVMGLIEREDHHALSEGAALVQLDVETVKKDNAANIRAAAALLARNVREISKHEPPYSWTEWRAAAVRLTGIPQPELANEEVGALFLTMAEGAKVELADETLVLRESELEDVARLAKRSQLSQALAAGQYPPSIWNPASPSNYSRGRSPLRYVVIHTTQGGYAGTISWFKNPAAGVSAHYVIRSRDGEITAMVNEADTAWHVRSANPVSIGIEHEGFIDNAAWYTEAMYRSSAQLVCAILKRYNLPANRDFVRGHIEVPGNNHSDPGPNWNWNKYMGYVSQCRNGQPIGECTVGGAIGAKHAALGGNTGLLGKCIESERPVPDGVGRVQLFEKGSIYWHPNVGAFETHGLIRDSYASLKWEQGRLGYPTSDELAAADGVGRYQTFQRGAIYFHPSTGAWQVEGNIQAKWNAAGAETGSLGYPTTNETSTPDGKARFNHFQNGSIYWHPDRGALIVRAGIRAVWAANGWETGVLGYPTSDELASADGKGAYQTYVGGNVYWSAETGAKIVRGAILQRYTAIGAEQSALGYPTTDELGTPDKRGRYNHFKKTAADGTVSEGSIYWTPTTGARALWGPIREKWASLDWERGLGYPSSDMTETATGFQCEFEKATVTWDTTSGQVTVTNK